MNQYQFNQPVYVVISLDTLKMNKSLKYHDMILEEMTYFDTYNIPIYLITPDEQIYLDSIKSFYQSSIHYIGNPTKDYFYSQNLIKNKQVYGKNYEIIYTNLRVYHEERVIYQVNHINVKTLKTAYLKALEQLFQIFKKNFKKMLTHI